MAKVIEIKGIGFDLEGPLVNVEGIHHRAHYQSAGLVGVMLDFETALRKLPHFIGGPDEKIAEEIWNMSDMSLTPQQIQRVKDTFYELGLGTFDIQPRPGFVEFLDQARAAGLQTAIGSSTPPDRAKVLLERSGIGQLFPPNRIVLKNNVRFEKPHPHPYLATARRMEIPPGRQVIFDDSVRGIRSGVAANSIAVGMLTFDRLDLKERLMAAGASIVYAGWRQVDLDEVAKLGNPLYPTRRYFFPQLST